MDEFFGHPLFYKLTEDEIRLHSRKNKDYALGGDPLGNFRRVANILSQYPGLPITLPAIVAIVYALKQLDASLWMIAMGREGEVESIDSRLADIHVYVKLARILLKENEDGTNL